jgi:hypothetical protein
MKVSHTLIALVILAALGGVFYYLNQQPAETSSTSSEPPKKKVVAFDAGQVEEFTIEVPDQPTATVRRAAAAAGASGAPPSGDGAAQWEIVAPAEIAADSAEVRSFVEEIPKLEGTPLEGGPALEPSEYGLDNPQKTFRFKLKDGRTVALSIGKENITGSSKYAKLDSAPDLFLLETATARVLDKTLFDLRDKRAIPVNVDNAQEIAVEFDYKGQAGQPAQAGRFVFTKQSNGNWQLTAPAVRTDFGSSNYFVTALGGAVLRAVEEEAPAAIARFGLNKPAIRLTVKLADGRSANLLVGNKAGDEAAYYAQNSVWPQVFKINQTTYDQFNQQLDNYRRELDRALLTFRHWRSRDVLRECNSGR